MGLHRTVRNMTVAMQAEYPYHEQTLKQGNEGGEASALASNGWRVLWLRRTQVKAWLKG